MGLPLTQLIVTLSLAHCIIGLILLKPESSSDVVIDFGTFPDSDIFDKMLDISKPDLSAYQHLQQTRPFEQDESGVVNDMYGDEYTDMGDDDEYNVPVQFDDVSPDSDEIDTIYDDADDLYKTEDMPSLHRRKRSVVGHVDAKVEVLVVVDNTIYRRYLDKTHNQREALAMLRQYYGMVFAMVDQRFKTIEDPELSISVKISGILVSESRQESSWVEYLVSWSRRGDEGRVNANKALKKFIKWLLSQKNLPKYDHAMAFTGYQLVNRASIDLGGMAYVSSICNTRDGNSASIVSDPGDFQVVKVATHELGHSLGSSHDGDKNNKDCPPDYNYIMAPQTTNEHNKLKNAFYFSRCSVRQMKKMLRSDEAKCVRDSPVIYYQYNLERQPPGQRYMADQQCQLIFGKESKFCETENMKSVMCGQLWCKDPENGRTCRTHSYLTALPGTTCGTGKVCHLGACVKNPYGVRPTDRIQLNHEQRQSARLNSQLNTDRNKPTFRIRSRLNSARRPARRRPSNKTGRRRNRGKGRGVRQRNRSRGQCSADQNDKYCSGLMKINPRACRRKAVRKYCCKTCAYRRRRRRI